MAKSKIQDYMEPQIDECDTTLLQAKVSRELKDQFTQVLKAKHRTIKEFIEASMLKFIDENRKTS
jgi:vacuolar-type H+-ATPase subunit C/Vma6